MPQLLKSGPTNKNLVVEIIRFPYTNQQTSQPQLTVQVHTLLSAWTSDCGYIYKVDFISLRWVTNRRAAYPQQFTNPAMNGQLKGCLLGNVLFLELGVGYTGIFRF